jgi:adenylyltransferase/sulfurtransferase
LNIRTVDMEVPNTDTSDQSKRIQRLQERIQSLERENAQLRSKNGLSEQEDNTDYTEANPHKHTKANPHKLSPQQIERYSRQLLISGGFGVEGQLKLLQSSVLIVGAGGIGSTVILYLAASGVGKMTIIDFDEVDVSNLHRQVIHKSCDVGMNKAESACRAVKALNPSIECNVVKMPLTNRNALELVSEHDCVIDASDNPQTRYTINDACVIGGKPLVSGSAMGFEGQLTVYNYKGGPCYRCLYPKPNVSEGCKTCADNGVLGPVPGIIGILQAMETLKIITDYG